MVDVIDISDDPIEIYGSYVPPGKTREVIDLTDGVDEVESLGHESEPRSSLSKTNTPKGIVNPSVGRNILDLGNWVSSEEDSFNVSLLHSPPRRETSLKQAPITSSQTQKTNLPSSPIFKGSNDVFEFDFSRPGSSQKRGPQDTVSVPNGHEDENLLFVPNLEEDLSSQPSSQPSRVPIGSVKKRKYPVGMSSDPIQDTSSVSATPVPVKRKSKAPKIIQVDPNDRSTKAWKDANKVMRRKPEILKEMVIEISLCLSKKIQTEYFRSVFLLPSVRNSYLEIPLISWKRRVTARYDKSEDIFIPCELTELTERVMVLFYEAEDLVYKLKSNVVAGDIDKAKQKARSEDPSKDYFICIMVPGFNEYLKKLQAKENKQYRARTLQQLNPTQRVSALREDVSVSSTEAQRLLVESEVKLGISIFMTKTIDESIDWLHSFTYTIGSSLYDKFERNPTFCNVGVSRSGADAKGTFLEMVKKFKLMTEPKAENLFQYYSSPLSLFKRFMDHGGLGAVQGRNIVPPSVNKIMNKVFTCDDPEAVITD